MKAILSPMGVSIGSICNIGNLKFNVKKCEPLVFKYHPKTQRTTLKVGFKNINDPKKIDSLLEYVGYTNERDMYRDFGKSLEFGMDGGILVLYLLEFTEESFKFT